MSQHDAYVATNTLLMLICQPRLQIAIEISIGLNYYYVLRRTQSPKDQRDFRVKINLEIKAQSCSIHPPPIFFYIKTATQPPTITKKRIAYGDITS